MGTSSQIRVLPAHVANKIAAGEVVERPASVVKELIENSIDAHARQIDVEVTAGGRKLICVGDDGSGMSRDDALLSIEPHATSKIRDVEDIDRIGTLGFRGEALAAISSVSRFRLVTCAQGETEGTEILVSGGKLQDVRSAGVPAGTRTEIRDLFFNVPARRKFLRAQQTELAHVRSCFLLQAIAYPAVGMSLKVDGREAYRLASDSDLEQRLRDLFGATYLKEFRTIHHAFGGLKVEGFAGIPSRHRPDRADQYLFVNRRPVTAPALTYAIREAYHSLIPSNRHPALFLFLEMDPEEVDVNVHPTKREVRFRAPNELRDTVTEAIRIALGYPSLKGQSAGFNVGTGSPEPLEKAGGFPLRDIHAAPASSGGTQLKMSGLGPISPFPYPRVFPQAPVRTNPVPAPSAAPAPAPSATPGRDAPWSWCRVLGQVGGLYVVMETEDGLVLMDPHAAHERILFERFQRDVSKGPVASQALLIPQTVELSPEDARRVRENLDWFVRMGFGLSEFGGDAFVVDALPPYFMDAPATELLVEIAHGLEIAGERGGSKGRWQEEAIAQAACKAAVKARDRLTPEAIEKLIHDLGQAEMPYTCPHGRPTLIFLSFSELRKKFGRE